MFKTNFSGHNKIWEAQNNLMGTAHEYPPMATGQPCGSIATKLSRLDACEDWKVVRWCRTQASSHSSQGVVDGGVDKAGVSTAAPDRSTVA